MHRLALTREKTKWIGVVVSSLVRDWRFCLNVNRKPFQAKDALLCVATAFGVIFVGIWILTLTDSQKAQTDKAQIELEYQEASKTVLEDLAGLTPESEPYLTVIPRDGRTIRINKRSGSWCVLIDNPSNPLLYGSCSESDEYAKKIRFQKSLLNRIRHFLNTSESRK